MQIKQVFVTMAAVGLLASGYALGQSQLTAGQNEFLMAHLKIETENNPNNYVELSRLYLNAPNDSKVVQQAIRMALVDRGKGDTTSLLAIQVAQNQKLIEQQQQIISLLQKK